MDYSPRLTYVLPGKDGETISPAPEDAMLPPIGSRVTYAPNSPSSEGWTEFVVDHIKVELRHYPSDRPKTIQITWVYLALAPMPRARKGRKD